MVSFGGVVYSCYWRHIELPSKSWNLKEPWLNKSESPQSEFIKFFSLCFFVLCLVSIHRIESGWVASFSVSLMKTVLSFMFWPLLWPLYFLFDCSLRYRRQWWWLMVSFYYYRRSDFSHLIRFRFFGFWERYTKTLLNIFRLCVSGFDVYDCCIFIFLLFFYSFFNLFYCFWWHF